MLATKGWLITFVARDYTSTKLLKRSGPTVWVSKMKRWACQDRDLGMNEEMIRRSLKDLGRCQPNCTGNLTNHLGRAAMHRAQS